jgi:hypothetical protein
VEGGRERNCLVVELMHVRRKLTILLYKKNQLRGFIPQAMFTEIEPGISGSGTRNSGHTLCLSHSDMNLHLEDDRTNMQIEG